MNEKTLSWDDLHLFLAVAREGGLSPAARTTQRSAATLGRRMLALERSLGRELFIRHDRGYELTRDAQRLLHDLEGIEGQILRLSTVRDGALPVVKLSAGTWTTMAILQHLDHITGTPPDLKIRFLAAEHSLDIGRREVVIGIRNQRPTVEGLAGRKLLRVDFAPYATADGGTGWIKVLADTPSGRWLHKTVGSDAVCEVNSPRNSLDLALAGMGIALLPTFIGDAQPDLHRNGAVVPELSHDQWIVTHQEDRNLPQVRRAIDRLCQVLKP